MNDILSRWTTKSTSMGRPLQASIELTNRCNERCTHCYIDDFSDDPKRTLDLQGWTRVLNELRSGGVLYLILMGGEAMLSPYFWPVLQKASTLGFHVSMITNGLLIKNQETADRLSNEGMSLATFSLYSMDSKTHDAMTRVRGSHQKLIQAIDFCNSAEIRPTINCLLTKNNIDKVFDVYEWAEEKNFELRVDMNVTPKFSGNLEPTVQRATRDQLTWYFSEMKRRYPEGFAGPSGEKTSDYVCNAAKGKCAVTAYGDLLPCIEIREPMGNLLESHFLNLWAGPTAEKWRSLKVGELEDVQSEGTELQNFCDHCPGLADHEHGDHLKMTEFSRMVAEIKKDLWST